MGILMAKLTSRKFWIAMIGIISSIVLMAIGALSPDQGLKSLLFICTAYLGVEGAGDFIQRFGIGQLIAGLFGPKKKKSTK